MKKKFFAAIAIIIILSVMLVACKESNDDEKTSVGGTTSSDTFGAIDLNEYTIVYQTDENNVYSSIAQNFWKIIYAKTNTRIAMEDDSLRSGDLPDDNKKEILIGATNRSQSTDTDIESDKLNYVIKIKGNKIIINGTTPYTVNEGLTYFAENFVQGPSTLISLPEITISTSEEAVLLASDNISNFYLVCYDQYNIADVEGFATVLSQNLKDKYDFSVGIKYVISSKVDAGIPVVIGRFDQNTKGALSESDIPEYCSIRGYGSYFMVDGVTPTSLEESTTMFSKMLLMCTCNGSTDILAGKNMIYSNEVDVYTYDAPMFSDGELVNVNETTSDGCLFTYDNADIIDYNTYCTKLINGGYSLYSTNSINQNIFSTYTNSKYNIHVYFIESLSRVKVVIEDSRYLPVVESQPITNKVTDASLTQLKLEGATGMSYIITLEDNSFFIIDGGRTINTDHLYEELVSLNKRADGKIVIAAWLITHSHGDHYEAFVEFAVKYASKVTLESVIVNTPNSACASLSNDYNSYNSDGTTLPNYVTSYYGDNVNFYIPHTGQVFYVRNMKVEILYTYEDIFPEKIVDFNSTGIVTRMTLEGQTLLFLADSYTDAGDILVEMYGDTLQSDFVQLAHHGYENGVNLETYQCINAKYALWPQDSSVVSTHSGCALVKLWLTYSGNPKIYYSYNLDKTFTLPFNE